MIFMLFRFVFHFIFKQAPAAVLCGLVSMAALAYYPPDLWNADRVVYTKRNYYGISKVVDSDGIRSCTTGIPCTAPSISRKINEVSCSRITALSCRGGEILAADVFFRAYRPYWIGGRDLVGVCVGAPDGRFL